MSQSSIPGASANSITSRRSFLAVQCLSATQQPLFRFACSASLMLVFLAAAGPAVNGQTLPSSASPLSAQQPQANGDSNSAPSALGGSNSAPTAFGGSDGSADAGTASPRSGSGSDSTSSFGLSSDQIIEILQQNPDLVLEIKSQAADRLQEQGKQVDANQISDEMLYQQIATNAGLRANITTYLRARGYVSDDELQTPTSGAGSENEDGGLSAAQRALILSGGGDPTAFPAQAGLDDGSSSADEGGLPGTSSRSGDSSGVFPGGGQSVRRDRAMNRRMRRLTCLRCCVCPRPTSCDLCAISTRRFQTRQLI